MKQILLFLSFFLMLHFSYAQTVLEYQTASSTDNATLPPSTSDPTISATDLTAGSGIIANGGSTWNWRGFDPDNASFADAVADGDFWRWEFTVIGESVDLSALDIRVDRSGTGPDDFEIQAVVNSGTPISILTYDFNDGTAGVDFTNVDLSGIPILNTGDVVVFTLAAFNSESSSGTFDLETVDFNGNDSRSLRLYGNAVLPIQLTYFNAKIINNHVQLEWRTETELNNDYVQIERSANGKSFKAIEKVKGAGTTLEPQMYTYLDEQPLKGTNYYRLKQVDLDGTFEYHNTVVVRMDDDKIAELFPTFVRDQLTIQTDTQADVRILNEAGQVMRMFSVNGQESLDVSALAAGTYHVLIQTERKLETQRFIKQ